MNSLSVKNNNNIELSIRDGRAYKTESNRTRRPAHTHYRPELVSCFDFCGRRDARRVVAWSRDSAVQTPSIDRDCYKYHHAPVMANLLQVTSWTLAYTGIIFLFIFLKQKAVNPHSLCIKSPMLNSRKVYCYPKDKLNCCCFVVAFFLLLCRQCYMTTIKTLSLIHTPVRVFLKRINLSLSACSCRDRFIGITFYCHIY